MGLNKTNFFVATWILLLLAVWVETASKYTDENRPYEFGFSIEGEQHRHEKKDEKGIITGEFGFITGDGVYHVTVYATDENGNFKIISMKSIKVSPALDGSEGPLPAKPALKPAVGSIPPVGQQPITQPPVTTTVSTTTSKPASTLTVFTTAKPLNVPACSSCAIPSTTKRPPGLKPGELNFQTPGFSKIPQQQNKPNQFTPHQQQDRFPIQQNPQKNPVPQQQNPQKNPVPQQQNPPRNTFPIQPQNPPSNSFPLQNPPTNQFSVQNRQKPPVSELNTELVGPLSPGQVPNQDISQPEQPSPGLPPPILPNYPDLPTPQNPPDPFASKQVVPNLKPDLPNTNKVPNLSKPSRKPTFFPGLIHPPPSGQNPPVEGQLPPGVTSDDMLQLLYRFNYTVGFHGHYETGYKNGAKIGGYFVNGRDGISRIVEYTADENGYRPKVTFINLGLNSPNTPKEETEKEFGLKNYVFEWFSL